MPVSVHFRGPMLYVSDFPDAAKTDERLKEIVVPDGRESGEHADGSDKIPHVCQMLVMVPGQPERRVELLGTTVEISAPQGGGAPTIGNGFAEIPSLDDMVNSHPPAGVKRNSAADRVACTITMKGGTVTAEVPSFLVELPQHHEATAQPQQQPKGSIPLIGTWTAVAGRVSVKKDGVEVDSVDLASTTDVYIYNWDEDWNDPTPKQLRLPGKPPTKRFQDDDFKWLYQLLDPPSGMTWEQWLPTATGAQFPAPRSIDFESDVAITAKPAGSGTGSCNAARMRAG